ncbi:MAG: hypothetical protein ACRCUY_07955, partial [Thermoguttaceae bacterium]
MNWFSIRTIIAVFGLFFSTALVSMAVVSIALAQTEPPLCSPENRWALIVLADSFPTGSGAGDSDAVSFEQLSNSLRASLTAAGFPSEQIIVLSPNQKDSGAKPMRQNILAQLEWIKKGNIKGPLPNQPPLRRLDEACEVFVYVQMLGIRHWNEQFFVPMNVPMSEQGNDIASKLSAAELLAASAVTDSLMNSAVERRLLVINVLSPSITRGGFRTNIDGIDSKTLLQNKSITVPLVGFGQIIVNDQISSGVETINGFVDMFQRGLAGYADTSLQGNYDRRVTLRELAEYLEHYGNMAGAGSVQTLLLGHDFPISITNESISKSLDISSTQKMLERVGKGIMEMRAGNSRVVIVPNYQAAAESYIRAAKIAGTEQVRLHVSGNTTIYAEKGSRMGRPLKPDDSLILQEYEHDWFRVKEGWIRADAIIAFEVQK